MKSYCVWQTRLHRADVSIAQHFHINTFTEPFPHLTMSLSWPVIFINGVASRFWYYNNYMSEYYYYFFGMYPFFCYWLCLKLREYPDNLQDAIYSTIIWNVNMVGLGALCLYILFFYSAFFPSLYNLSRKH